MRGEIRLFLGRFIGENGKIAPMDFTAKLAQFTADRTLPDWVQEAVKSIVDEAQKSVRSHLELDAVHAELRVPPIVKSRH